MSIHSPPDPAARAAPRPLAVGVIGWLGVLLGAAAAGCAVLAIPMLFLRFAVRLEEFAFAMLISWFSNAVLLGASIAVLRLRRWGLFVLDIWAPLSVLAHIGILLTASDWLRHGAQVSAADSAWALAITALPFIVGLVFPPCTFALFMGGELRAAFRAPRYREGPAFPVMSADDAPRPVEAV